MISCRAAIRSDRPQQRLTQFDPTRSLRDDEGMSKVSLQYRGVRNTIKIPLKSIILMMTIDGFTAQESCS